MVAPNKKSKAPKKKWDLSIPGEIKQFCLVINNKDKKKLLKTGEIKIALQRMSNGVIFCAFTSNLND